MTEFWLNPPEDDRPIVFKCAVCGEEIRHGDWYFDMDTYEMCEECFNDFAKECHKEAEID